MNYLNKLTDSLKNHINKTTYGWFFQSPYNGLKKIDANQFVAKLFPITVVQIQTLPPPCKVSLNNPILMVQFSLMYTNSKLPS